MEEGTVRGRKSESIEAHPQHHVVRGIITVAFAAAVDKLNHSLPAEHHAAATHIRQQTRRQLHRVLVAHLEDDKVESESANQHEKEVLLAMQHGCDVSLKRNQLRLPRKNCSLPHTQVFRWDTTFSGTWQLLCCRVSQQLSLNRVSLTARHRFSNSADSPDPFLVFVLF